MSRHGPRTLHLSKADIKVEVVDTRLGVKVTYMYNSPKMSIEAYRCTEVCGCLGGQNQVISLAKVCHSWSKALVLCFNGIET